MNFPLTYIYCENLCVNQPLKVTFIGVVVAQSKVILRVTVLNLCNLVLNLPLNYFSLIDNFCEIIKVMSLHGSAKCFQNIQQFNFLFISHKSYFKIIN